MVCALILVAWVGSAWYAAQRNWGVQTARDFLSGVPNRGGGLLRVGAGEAYFVNVQPPTRMGGVPGWNVERSSVPFRWSPSIQTRVDEVQVRVPLWIPLLLAIGVTVWIWRLDKIAQLRAAVHSCAKCGYSRTGLAPTAVCPECGAVHSIAPSN